MIPTKIQQITGEPIDTEPRVHEQASKVVNVSSLERWASGIGGGGLAAYGLLRRDWLGLSFILAGGALAYRGLSGHSLAYQMLGLNTAERSRKENTSVPHRQGIKIEKAVTINRPVAELYQFWHDFENLPRFMEHLQSVTVTDPTHSHWVTKAPAGQQVEWDAEIINDKQNELIAWRSLADSQIDNAGSVHFTPAHGGRGTEVRVVLEYVPPARRFGSLIAKIFGEEPEQQVREDLRHFKEMMETGEIATTQGQTSGRERKKKEHAFFS